jgi:hypothetical protein
MAPTKTQALIDALWAANNYDSLTRTELREQMTNNGISTKALSAAMKPKLIAKIREHFGLPALSAPESQLGKRKAENNHVTTSKKPKQSTKSSLKPEEPDVEDEPGIEEELEIGVQPRVEEEPEVEGEFEESVPVAAFQYTYMAYLNGDDEDDDEDDEDEDEDSDDEEPAATALQANDTEHPGMGTAFAVYRKVSDGEWQLTAAASVNNLKDANTVAMQVLQDSIAKANIRSFYHTYEDGLFAGAVSSIDTTVYVRAQKILYLDETPAITNDTSGPTRYVLQYWSRYDDDYGNPTTRLQILGAYDNFVDANSMAREVSIKTIDESDVRNITAEDDREKFIRKIDRTVANCNAQGIGFGMDFIGSDDVHYEVIVMENDEVENGEVENGEVENGEVESGEVENGEVEEEADGLYEAIVAEFEAMERDAEAETA